jgi:hypothetical protein
MGHGDSDIIGTEDDMVTVRTKPCWICGQYSFVTMPYIVAAVWDHQDIHIEDAWPQGPAADKQLLLTGVHPKCWEQEFPDQPKEKK